jgi:hypothetical protein
VDARVGHDASRVKRNEHSLADIDQLAGLFRAATFHSVVIETVTRTIRFTSVDEYVNAQPSATPHASLLPKGDTRELQRLVDLMRADIRAALGEFSIEGTVAVPQQVHVVLAA